MAEPSEPSSLAPSPSNLVVAKPVVVRVKRKLSQARLDAFWLEINERPLKRPLLDFESLSLSDSSGKVLEESKTKKLLVQHVESVSCSEALKDVLQSILPNSSGSKDLKSKIEERRRTLNQDKKKQDQLRSAARQKHEDLARGARFEQIWRNRRGSKEVDDDLFRELCHLYDVVQVDIEVEKSEVVQEAEKLSVEDTAIFCNYLPLMRELLPTAAKEIESEVDAYMPNEDNYVYDLYTVDDSLNGNEDTLTEYPRVEVNEDDDYYDDPLQSDYETDDSNAEDNPLNDYPDEESSKDEGSDEADGSDEDEGSDDEDPFNVLQGSDNQYEEEIYSDEEDTEYEAS